MLDDKGNTCAALNSVYDGITSDYEINNGEQYFKVNEIEVFQILFSWIYFKLIVSFLIN